MEEGAQKFMGKSLNQYLEEDGEVCICCARRDHNNFPSLKIPTEATEYKRQYLEDKRTMELI